MGISQQIGASSLSKPGVCTSSTRPATPYEGQMIYETDTDLMRIWTGAAWRSLAAAAASSGSVLQIVQGSDVTQRINSTTTYADTSLTASITPSSTSNKILVQVVHNGCGKEAGNAGSELQIALLRGATEIGFASGASTNVSEINYFGSITISVLDSPSTTSSTTYKTQFKNYANAASVRIGGGNISGSVLSTITLMEIAG